MDEKPFQCKWPGCGKGFARQHDCKRHEQLHSNHRPFTCEGCKKPFARLDALNRHRESCCCSFPFLVFLFFCFLPLFFLCSFAVLLVLLVSWASWSAVSFAVSPFMVSQLASAASPSASPASSAPITASFHQKDLPCSPRISISSLFRLCFALGP